MGTDRKIGGHSAEAATLGFYYQAFFALLTLLTQDTDNAAVGVEQLDDVTLDADGQTLLYQLKHSISAAPSPISLKSKALWRTIKVWTDALPELALSETTLHLVTVGAIVGDSPLLALTSIDADRSSLLDAMIEEAQRVVEARATAAKSGKSLPHGDRIDGCAAFLNLGNTSRINLIRRILIKQDSPSIDEIESRVANQL